MTRRQKAIGFFITLCVLLVGAAILLNIYWIVITEKQLVELLVGILLFALIIAGIIVYTVFLVMEIKRNEDHDTFINAVTHELKTPLASIRLYLDTLKARPVTDPQRQEFYDVMLADVERLRHTVDQVLKAGVVREKQRAAIRTQLDMGLLARECVDLAVTRHHLPPGAIALEAHDGASLMVRGDAEELRTVITNLLDNAVKYSVSDVRVTVSLAAPAPDTIWVRVQDRGVGIPRKQLKRIFNRFYRVQARGIRQVKGTGLGLYIVRAIARKHGGRVFAQSEGEGRGATFTVELPRATS
ncbi:MAG TPA: HAMP domain-containing sensor histidine kinase [Vicinamibacterales bacterium]|jgi:signal transduction histidine kinase|nr:HAMP domain-containing sensor histidine kinase [Vicinamibacterales bacterium]